MQFIVTQVSTWGEDTQPCEGAVRVSEGGWTIEIGSLEVFMAFCNREGSLIVEPVCEDSFLPNIIIYDGYVE